MHLEIITPEKTVFEAEVISVAVPGKDGEFQVLNNHAPLLAALTDGKVKIDAANLSDELVNLLEKSTSDNRFEYTIKGGVFQFVNNKAIVLAE